MGHQSHSWPNLPADQRKSVRHTRPTERFQETLNKLQEIYDSRFDENDFSHKDRLWRELTRHLQRYVGETATVLDIGCDKGYFIRNIRAGEKWATDLRDVSDHLAPDI